MESYRIFLYLFTVLIFKKTELTCVFIYFQYLSYHFFIQKTQKTTEFLFYLHFRMFSIHCLGKKIWKHALLQKDSVHFLFIFSKTENVLFFRVKIFYRKSSYERSFSSKVICPNPSILWSYAIDDIICDVI